MMVMVRDTVKTVMARRSNNEAKRNTAIDANVQNLREFTDYANARGVETGLWTQSNLEPVDNEQWHLQRDFKKEVEQGGISTLKTDVAWVGSGYSFGLNGIKKAYDVATNDNFADRIRPNIVTLDGWAGTQRYGGIWTGDQTGGNWEYIRFHLPTYIGQGLSGNPNVGSDMDGIFGGAPIIATRDYQWKTFTPTMLDMDGWGTYRKSPMTHGDPYTGISRMYLKLKAQLMPYIYTSAASAANIDTSNGDTGLPMIRAMMLTDDSEFAAGTERSISTPSVNTSWSRRCIRIRPTAGNTGNDVRNGIYLPNYNKTKDGAVDDRTRPSGSITSPASSIVADRFSTTSKRRCGSSPLRSGGRHRSHVRGEQQPPGNQRDQQEGPRQDSSHRRVLACRRLRVHTVRGRRQDHQFQPEERRRLWRG